MPTKKKAKPAPRRRKKAAPQAEAATPLLPQPQAAPGPKGHSTPAAWALMGAGLFIMAWVAPWQYPARPLWSAIWSLIGAASLFIGFVWLPRHEAPVKDPYYGGRLALLMLLAAFSIGRWPFIFELHLGLIVAAVALWIYLSGDTLATERDENLKTPLWALGAVLLLVLAGGLLRFHDLMGIPNGLHMDEVGTSDNFERAWRVGILFGWVDNLCASGTLIGQGVGVLASQLLAKFGIHSILNLRMGQAIYGTLALPAAFLLMRLLFGWSAALWSLAFLAFSRFGIAGSRHMVYDSPRIFFECLIFYTFWKGIRGSWLWFIPSGVLLGFALYGCHYTQFIIPVLLGAYLFLAVYLKKVPLPRGIVATVLIFGLAAAAFYPMYRAMQRYSVESFMMRANQVEVAHTFAGNALYLGTLLNTNHYLHQYTDSGAISSILGLSMEPILDPWSGLLMFLGLAGAAVAWHRRRLEGAFCVGWFLAGLAPGIFSDIIPVPYRISLQTPVIFGMAGLAADQIVRFPACRPNKLLKWAGFLAMAFFAVQSAWWSYQSYFVKYPKDAQSRGVLGGFIVDMAREVRNLPPGVEIVASNAFNSGATNPVIFNRLAQRDWRWSTTQWSTTFPRNFKAGKDAYVFAEACFELFYPNFKSLFPNSEMYLHTNPDQPVLFQGPGSQLNPGNPFCTVKVPASDVAKARGCRLEFSGPRGRKVVEGTGLLLTDEDLAQKPSLAQWKGSIFIPARTGLILQGTTPRGFSLVIDGKEWRIGQIRVLEEGFVPFRASLMNPGADTTDINLTLAGRSGEESVPLYNPDSLRPAAFSRGLRASYYPAKPGPRPGMVNFSEAGEPQVTRIEPTLFLRWDTIDIYRSKPISGGSYLATWKGHLDLPETGKYQFYDELGQKELSVWIDGRLVYPRNLVERPSQGLEVVLAKGRHSFRARYEATPNIYSNMVNGPALMAIAPGAPATLLPMAWLDPE